MTTIGVIGLGYVGLPLAIGFSSAGHDVVGFDVSEPSVALLLSGRSQVDDVTDHEIGDYLASGSVFSTDPSGLNGCSVFIICVPTPLDASGHPDLGHVEAATRTVGAVLSEGDLVILESSTHPGTTDSVVAPLLEKLSGLSVGKGFSLAYSPERIDPGNPQFGLDNTPKIVGGYDDTSTKRAADVYSSIGISVVEAKGLREAEIAKLLENTYRHVNIALVNEMVKFCRPLGIDLWDAIRCAATKPFGFEAFYPGPGVGGHCIPIDPHYLSYQVRIQLGRPFRFVELAQEINASMPAYVVERVTEELNESGLSLKGSRVLIVGVTYKANVSDLRETPALPLARLLRDRGAVVEFADPHVQRWVVDNVEVPRYEFSAPSEHDIALLLQNHSLIEDADILRCATIILDTRAHLSAPHVRYL